MDFSEVKGEGTGVPGGLSQAGVFRLARIPVLWAAGEATGYQL